MFFLFCFVFCSKTQSLTWLPSVSKGGTHSAGDPEPSPLMRWNRLTSPSAWSGMKNKCHGGWQRASVSYQSGQCEWWFLSGLCSVAVYYPKVAGQCWEERRTGSPFVIHHSGGLLPLLSDCYMDNRSSCLQTPAIWMSSRHRKRFLGSFYQSRWVLSRMGCITLFFFHIPTSTCIYTHTKTEKKARK